MPPAEIPITARTRVVGVIGDPIEHSRSPAMHNAAFRALRLPYVYAAFRVAAADVGEALAGARALGIAGLNVTIPHKQAVIEHLDALSPAAHACAAVNTIVRRDGRLLGENTDVVGLERDLAEKGFVRQRGGTGIVLGAGGSARAVVVALGRRLRRVVVAARRVEQSRALVAALRSSASAELVALRLEDLAAPADTSPAALALRRARVVVNTTPVGMRGEPFLDFAYAATPPDCAFYDLIYTAPRTPFLSPAARLRRPVANGLGMLLHQGAAAFALWTGVEPPLEVMRRALRRAAAR
jgi:shikimate dehydrogenase